MQTWLARVAHRFLRGRISPILLYHAAFEQPPATITRELHNVAPDVIRRQVSWLRQHFDIVPVDALFGGRHEGKAAITFDDAYTSIFATVVPDLVAEGVPVTIFLNGASLEGRPLWRDKIRHVINRGLVADFFAYVAAQGGCGRPLEAETFYRMSKDPSVSSARMDELLDAFFGERDTEPEDLRYCAARADLPAEHPLITYGNHTVHHYVLTSLTPAEQEAEIAGNHEQLQNLGRSLSAVFAVPFGGARHVNDTTRRILRDLGYRGLLYSRNRVNGRAGMQAFPSRERYMAGASLEQLQVDLAYAGYRGLRR